MEQRLQTREGYDLPEYDAPLQCDHQQTIMLRQSRLHTLGLPSKIIHPKVPFVQSNLTPCKIEDCDCPLCVLTLCRGRSRNFKRGEGSSGISSKRRGGGGGEGATTNLEQIFSKRGGPDPLDTCPCYESGQLVPFKVPVCS